MTAVQISCPRCLGQGWHTPPGTWVLCSSCDGIGLVWAPGAPAFECKDSIGDHVAGEVVELGNGDVGRILWHSPRATKNQRPEVSYLGMIDEFDGYESSSPTRYPSSVGVRSVRIHHSRGDDDHYGERVVDPDDPMQKRRGGALL
jgi:hypothetical protein